MTAAKRPNADRIRADAKGQFAPTEAEPNLNGRASAKPSVLSGDGDATFDHAGQVERRAHGGAAVTAWGDREPAGIKPKPQR